MKKGPKLVLVALGLIFSVLTNAQDLRLVKGSIQDTSNHPIAKVTVTLYYETPGDTLHAITSNDGLFSFTNVKNRPFFIKTTHLGFAPYVKQYLKEGQSIELDIIRLTPAIISLDEIIVTSPTIQIKEDTIEYKADSFKVKPNAMVEDLLKKLPGVSVDKDGNVTAQGKQVSKVRVNGKDFFQGDVKTATREINADMIDKVQIVDDYGDQANMSGIKDGEPDKVLNLQLKKDKNKGVFGRVTGGYGTDERYQGSLNANYFNNNTQVSVFGNSNNINASVFNNDGNNNMGGPGARMMMVSSGGGGNGGGGGGGGGGGNFSIGNNSLGGSDGIATGNSIGTNFRTDFTGSHKGSLYGSYIFIRRETDILRNTSQQNIFQGSNFINNQNTSNNSISNMHRAQLNFEYNLDSFTYLKITPQLNIQDNNSTNLTIFDYLRDVTLKTSDGINRDSSLSNNPSMNANILFNRKFRKKGRNFSINAFVNNSTTGSDKFTNNFTNNYVPNISELLIKQLVTQDNSNKGFNLRINYSEPIAKDRFLDLIYSYRKNFVNNDRKTFDRVTGFDVLNMAQSNAFDNDFIEQRYGANIRTVKKKYNYSLGVTVQPVQLKGYSITKDSAYTPQNRINVFPVARMSYNFSRTKGLNFNYQGNARQPSFSQLQPVRDVSNPQYQTQGNPLLKPERVHNLNLFFNNFNFQSGRVIFTGVNANFIENQIVNNNIRLGANGTQLSIPQNVNGYYNLTGFYNFSKPFQNRKYVFSVNGSANYNHNIALVDSVQNIGKNWVFAQGVSGEYNLKEWFEFDLGARYSLNAASYSLNNNQNFSYSSWTLTSNSRIDMPGGLIFRYDFQYVMNQGLSSDVSRNIALLNASLEKTVFKKKNGFIRLSGFDIFKQNTNVSRTITGNFITDTRVNRLTRYFMLTFTYRLNRFQGQQPTQGGPGGNMPRGG